MSVVELRIGQSTKQRSQIHQTEPALLLLECTRKYKVSCLFYYFTFYILNIHVASHMYRRTTKMST